MSSDRFDRAVQAFDAEMARGDAEVWVRESRQGEGTYATSDDEMAGPVAVRDANWDAQVKNMRTDHLQNEPGPHPTGEGEGAGKKTKLRQARYACAHCGEHNMVEFDAASFFDRDDDTEEPDDENDDGGERDDD